MRRQKIEPYRSDPDFARKAIERFPSSLLRATIYLGSLQFKKVIFDDSGWGAVAIYSLLGSVVLLGIQKWNGDPVSMTVHELTELAISVVITFMLFLSAALAVRLTGAPNQIHIRSQQLILESKDQLAKAEQENRILLENKTPNFDCNPSEVTIGVYREFSKHPVVLLFLTLGISNQGAPSFIHDFSVKIGVGVGPMQESEIIPSEMVRHLNPTDHSDSACPVALATTPIEWERKPVVQSGSNLEGTLIAEFKDLTPFGFPSSVDFEAIETTPIDLTGATLNFSFSDIQFRTWQMQCRIVSRIPTQDVERVLISNRSYMHASRWKLETKEPITKLT